MKTRLITTLLTLTLLFIIGCTSSDEAIEMETLVQDDPEIQSFDVSRYAPMSSSDLLSLLREEHLSSKANDKKSRANKTKPYWSAEYSNFYTEQGQIIGPGFIPGTDLVAIWDYPINGEDRIHINGDEGHITWNIKEPRVQIFDVTTGLKLYSNYCEDKREGFFQETLKGKVDFIDVDGDGTTDLNRINAFAEDSDYHAHIKTVLTDAQNNLPYFEQFPDVECNVPTTEIKFEAKIRIKRGIVSGYFLIDGVKYEG